MDETSRDKPRLIERAFPLKQASLDSVHEKNVRHGHISTLHIWPARRPPPTTPTPQMVRVQDPFGSLLTTVKGSMLISHSTIAQVVER